MVEQVIALSDFLRKIFCYKGYVLQIGDNDEKKKYEGNKVENNEGVVRELQEDLKTLGYNAIFGEPDGDFGLNTYRAVRAFQFDYIDEYRKDEELLEDDIIQFYDYQGIKTNGIVNEAIAKAIKEESISKNVVYSWEKQKPKLLDVKCQTAKGFTELTQLEPSAAYDFQKLVKDVEAEGGKLIINSMYRVHYEQVRVKALWRARGKPNNASTPGKSNHGFGCAIDVNRNKLWLIHNEPTSKIQNTNRSDLKGQENIDRFRVLALKNCWYPIAHKKAYTPSGSPQRADGGAYGYAAESWHFNHTPMHQPVKLISKITLRKWKEKEDQLEFDTDPLWKYCYKEIGSNEYKFKIIKTGKNKKLYDKLNPCDCEDRGLNKDKAHEGKERRYMNAIIETVKIEEKYGEYHIDIKSIGIPIEKCVKIELLKDGEVTDKEFTIDSKYKCKDCRNKANLFNVTSTGEAHLEIDTPTEEVSISSPFPETDVSGPPRTDYYYDYKIKIYRSINKGVLQKKGQIRIKLEECIVDLKEGEFKFRFSS